MSIALAHARTFLAAIILTLAANAGAQTSNDSPAAEALFSEGRRLLEAKRFEEACDRFARSYELDPAIGTLLNLASCQESLGRTASAWTNYRDAEALAVRDGDKRRAAAAKKRAAALEPKLAHLTLHVPDASRVSGLTLTRDGKSVPEASWGVAIPVDPGPTEIEAKAPGRRSWQKTLKIVAAPDQTSIEVPTLEETGETPEAVQPRPAPVVKTTDVVRGRDASAETGRNTQRTVGYVVAGAGIVGVGVGAYFGLVARSKWKDARAHCPEDGSRCDTSGVAFGDDAKSAARISNVGFIAGGVALGAGIALVLTAPKADKRVGRAPPSVGVALGRQGGVVEIGGRY